MKKNIICLLLISILIPFNTLFAASYGGSSKSSYGGSSKSSSISNSTVKGGSFGNSSKSNSSYENKTSKYGTSNTSSSINNDYKKPELTAYDKMKNNEIQKTNSIVNNSQKQNNNYGSPVNNSNYSNTSNNIKTIATGAAIGTGAGVAANELQNQNNTSKYGTSNTNSSINNDYKKPELTAYDKMKNNEIQKTNSVVDNSPKQKTIEQSKNNYSNSVNNSNYSNSVNNSNYSNRNNNQYTRKVYHYNSYEPYGQRYNSYGVGNYYGHTTMDYLPAMMLIYMLTNNNDHSNDYYARQYYQERQNDSDMKKWREEMEEQSYNNKEIKNLLYKLDHAEKPNTFNDIEYSKQINNYSQTVNKDKQDYSSSNGTELKYDENDYILKDEILYKAQ